MSDGRNLIYTDVFLFADRLGSFMEDERTAESAERQLIQMFQVLLSGPAVRWWNNEVSLRTRHTLHRGSLEDLIDALVKRWTPDAAIATKKFTEGSIVTNRYKHRSISLGIRTTVTIAKRY